MAVPVTASLVGFSIGAELAAAFYTRIPPKNGILYGAAFIISIAVVDKVICIAAQKMRQIQINRTASLVISTGLVMFIATKVRPYLDADVWQIVLISSCGVLGALGGASIFIPLEAMIGIDEKKYKALQTIELPENATYEAAKEAYKRLVLQWHPDRNKDPGAPEKFRQIQASWKYLSELHSQGKF